MGPEGAAVCQEFNVSSVAKLGLHRCTIFPFCNQDIMSKDPSLVLWLGAQKPHAFLHKGAGKGQEKTVWWLAKIWDVSLTIKNKF